MSRTRGYTQRSTAEFVNDSSENVDFKREKYLVTDRMLILLCHITLKTVLPKKRLFLGIVSTEE